MKTFLSRGPEVDETADRTSPASPALYEGDVRSVVRSRALLADPRFLSLWLSQGLAQTAQNALLFTLLVVVLELTGSSVATSILVFCFILPSIPLGFVVGCSWTG